MADVEPVPSGKIEFPNGYHPELIGEFAERQAASQRILGYAGCVAALLIILPAAGVPRELAPVGDGLLERCRWPW